MKGWACADGKQFLGSRARATAGGSSLWDQVHPRKRALRQEGSDLSSSFRFVLMVYSLRGFQAW